MSNIRNTHQPEPEGATEEAKDDTTEKKNGVMLRKWLRKVKSAILTPKL
jgi:hypothetical protein